MATKLSYCIWVLFKKTLHEAFTTFMKEEHLKKIWQTGLFDRITLTPSEVEDPNGICKVLITYYPKSAQAWDEYKQNHQPALASQYKEKFAIVLHEGSMKVDRIIGNEEVLFGE